MVQPRRGWEDIGGLFPRWRKLTGGYVYLTPVGVKENIHKSTNKPQTPNGDKNRSITDLAMSSVYCQICYVVFYEP